jgi:hypothetical protein
VSSAVVPDVVTSARLAGEAGSPEPGRSSSRDLAKKVSMTASATRGSVERKVVSLILSASARKLPRSYIDPTVGTREEQR